jgi:pimeloyl-ACP methyl ester carboxylesterase
MREESLLSLDPHGFHRMRYTEWGDPGNPRVLVCVHGLTRNGRDFDYLAEKLSDTYRVVCPDIVGRGQSDWLRVKADYGYPTYMSDLSALMAKLGAEEVHWVGTSMGGILGMLTAGVPGTPVRKLVMNDVGAMIPKAALERLGMYVGTTPTYDSLEALEAAIRSVSPFGPLTDADWRQIATSSSKQNEAGQWVFRYDPGLSETFKGVPFGDVDMRHFWNAIKCPVLVIRGDSSDLLTAETLEEMKQRPNTQTHIVPNTGHAPMLMDDAQVAVIRQFLLGP